MERIKEKDENIGFDDIFPNSNDELLPDIPMPELDLSGASIEEEKEIIDRTEDFEKEQNPKNDKHIEKVRLKGAALILKTEQLIVSKGCAAWSGNPSESYRLNKSDFEEVQEALFEVLQIMDIDVSPVATFCAIYATMLGARIYQAVEDKKENESISNQKEQRSLIKEIKKAAQEKEISPDLAQEMTAEFNRSIKKTKDRIRFEIDADNLFEYARKSEGGDYLQKEDRNERPSSDILAIIEDGKANKLTKGQINQKCRKFLYGSE